MTPTSVPLQVTLSGRDVLVVGGGAGALGRARALAEAGARITVVAPRVRSELAALAWAVHLRPFRPGDLAGSWLAVAAATPDVNAAVERAAEPRRVFVDTARAALAS
jgi:siroheme synthase-like protein